MTKVEKLLNKKTEIILNKQIIITI